MKYMETFANEKCEQNCCEHPSERETALIRIMKQDMNYHVGLGRSKQDMK